MKTITYSDLDGAAPRVEWHGREFITGRPVEVDDNDDAALIEAASGNPAFEVKDGSVPVKGGSSPYDRGYKAGSDAKDRVVPPAYRAKPEETAWLAGFDDGAMASGNSHLVPGAQSTIVVPGAPASPGSVTSGEPIQQNQAGNTLTPAKPA